jgi:hypothetical protein
MEMKDSPRSTLLSQASPCHDQTNHRSHLAGSSQNGENEVCLSFLLSISTKLPSLSSLVLILFDYVMMADDFPLTHP